MKKLFAFAFILISSTFVFGQSSISGTISDSSGVAAAGRVKLFTTTGVFIDSTDFIADGTYSFSSVAAGNYYIVARGDTTVYPNHINTYYGQTPNWSSATQLSVQDTSVYTGIDILLIQIPNWAGTNNTGYCSGTIVSGSGQRAGDPIPGVDIALEQIPGGIIKANTETDANGFFEIEKIPNNTQYNLLVDIPGLPMDSTHTVTIMTGDTVVDLDFIVDTTVATAGIYVASSPVTSIFSFKKTAYAGINIYPNPSSNGVFVIELPFEQSDITIYNIDGKQLYSNNIFSNKARIDLSNDSKGIYFVEIKSKFGAETIKVLVQ